MHFYEYLYDQILSLPHKLISYGYSAQYYFVISENYLSLANCRYILHIFVYQLNAFLNFQNQNKF